MRAWIVAVALVFTASCGGKSGGTTDVIFEVDVEQAAKRGVTDFVELTGNVQASAVVQLQARVSGFLTKVNFKDGDFVKQGDLLFEIEPEPYSAKLAGAEANAVSAQAEFERASAEYNRQLDLVKKNAVAVSDVERWKAQRDALQAKLEQTRSEVELAKIQLSYTQLRAPFDGRVDRRLRDPGNLVGVGEPTLLTTIYRMNPIYAYFSLNEKDLVKLRKPKTDGEAPIKVFAAIEGEDGYPHEGVIDFSSASLDPGTGTLLLRAVFENPPFGLLPTIVPGMFVRLKIPVREREHALLVPNAAVGVDQGGSYVLVTTAQDTVDKKPVTTGALVDGLRVIESGLNGDEWVIVTGLQQARPGSKVKPVRR